jgi:hypothetical protein
LEELAGVTGRILNQDLTATYALHDLVAKAHAGGTQPLDLSREVRDME